MSDFSFRFRAWGVDFALSPLTLIAPLLAMRLGVRGGLFALYLALGSHELAHLLAAKLMRVDIAEIQLMPFGGSARIENPYRLSSAQLLTTALAGPAANLLLAVLLSALAQWRLLSPDRAADLISPNLLLAFFNLLPALPLDGGRALFALLRAPLGDRRALSWGIRLGWALSGALLLAFLIGGLRSGIWNLTFPLAAIFLLASGHDESAALSAARARNLSDALEDVPEPRPAHIYQLDAGTPARRVLSLLRPRERAWFVLTEGGAPTAVIDDRSVIDHLIHGEPPQTPLGALPGYRLARR